MPKSRHSAPPAAREFHHAVCGDVRISFNEENEVKVALTFPEGFAGQPYQALDALWSAYCAERLAEWRDNFQDHYITGADGQKIMTPLNAEDRAKRYRTFQTVALGHPADTEIRVENLLTMVKIASPMRKRSHVLRRMEIKIKQDLPGLVPFHEVPGKYGKKLVADFNGRQSRFAGVMTETFRQKITIPILFERWGQMFVIEYERAKDIGISISMAGHKRDILELEGEVKKIYGLEDYLRHRPVNLKKYPDRAGLTQAGVHGVIDAFLAKRLNGFLDFANNWLEMNGYEGCRAVPVTHSKSRPEMDALHDVLKAAPKQMRKNAVAAAVKRNGAFAVDSTLNALRRSLTV